MADPTRFASAQEVQLVSEAGYVLALRADGSLPIANSAKELVDAGALFSASVAQNLTSSGTESPVCLIRNPVGSGKRIYPVRFIGTIVATTGTIVTFRARRNPTVTANGTSVTPANAINGASAPLSVALVTSAPTVSAIGERVLTAGAVSGTAGGAFMDIAVPFSNRIDEGYSLLITGTPDGTNRAVELTVFWVEI